MSAPLYELLVVRGPSTGTSYALTNKNMTIGRDAVSDIQIRDPEVSRQHALIVPVPAGIQIQDLGSTNGTFVASERVGSKLVFVDPGQTVMLGSAVVLLLQVSDGVEDASEGNAPKESHQGVEPSAGTGAEGERLQNGSDSLEFMPPPKRELAKPDATALMAAQMPAATLPPQTVAAKESEIGMSPNLILGTVLLLLCCAFSLLLFLLSLGGDWLLRLAGLVP